MAFLPTEALDLGDCQATGTTGSKRLAHFFKFERFDDGGNVFHGVFRALSPEAVGNRITPIFAEAAVGQANADRGLAAFVLR